MMHPGIGAIATSAEVMNLYETIAAQLRGKKAGRRYSGKLNSKALLDGAARGLTQAQIAAELNLHQHTISKYLAERPELRDQFYVVARESRSSKSRRGCRPAIGDNELLALRESMSVEDIMAMFKVGRSWVYGRLRALKKLKQ